MNLKIENIPESGYDGGGTRANHVNELVDVQLTIAIDISHSEQSLDLLVGEPRARLPHLLLTENAVTVVIELFEQESGVVHIAHILRLQSCNSLA